MAAGLCNAGSSNFGYFRFKPAEILTYKPDVVSFQFAEFQFAEFQL